MGDPVWLFPSSFYGDDNNRQIKARQELILAALERARNVDSSGIWPL